MIALASDAGWVSTSTHLLVQILAHALVADNLVVVLQRTANPNDPSALRTLKRRGTRGALFLVLDPAALVAEAHQLPDQALHLVRQPIPLRRRVRVARAPSPPAAHPVLVVHRRTERRCTQARRCVRVAPRRRALERVPGPRGAAFAIGLGFRALLPFLCIGLIGSG